jgi:hypothetical protein
MIFSRLGNPFFMSCGDDGSRTRDLVNANHALSQLSYIPNRWIRIPFPCLRVLGFEPRTSALSELRSSHLSYTRLLDLAQTPTKLFECPCFARKQKGQTSVGLALSAVRRVEHTQQESSGSHTGMQATSISHW